MNYLRQKINDIYLFGCAFYIFISILFASEFSGMPHQHLLFSAARAVCYLCVCLKGAIDLFGGMYSKKEILVCGAVGAFLLVLAYTTGDKNPLIYWVFIAAGHNVDFQKLIKWAAIAHFAALAVIIAACYGGILDNITIERHGQDKLREGLGFDYASEAANFFFYAALLWIYYRKIDISIPETAVLLACAAALFWKTDTKSAFALTVLALTGTLVLKYSAYLRDYHAVYRVLALLAAPALAALIILVTYRYDPSVGWMQGLNRIVTNRLYYGKMGIDTFGVRLLGQRLEMVGGEYTAGYNYVDSSFVQILLNYGPVFLVVLLGGLVALGNAISQKRDTWFLLVFCLFLLHSTFDPQLIWIAFNDFLLAYAYIVDKRHPAGKLKSEGV